MIVHLESVYHHLYFQNQPSDLTEVTASFLSINILLIRSVKVRGVKSVRKVAEVSVSEVQLNASLGDGQRIDGSVGGLRIVDLTPEGTVHRSVFTCGSFTDGSFSIRDSSRLWSLPEDVQDGPGDRRAFTFTLLSPKKGGRCPRIVVEAPMEGNLDSSEITKNIQVAVHIASAQYTHTHRFLSELLLSAGDYADSAAQFGESLRQAASNVAMGLVSKKRALAEGFDYLSSSFVNPAGQQDERGLGSRQPSIVFHDDSDAFLDSRDFEDSAPVKPNRRVYSCITVESPVVHLPKLSSSTEMLVAHLGRITIRNTHLMELVEEESCGQINAVEHDVDRLFLEIKDMSLYCLTNPEAESGTHKNILYSSRFNSTHILHKTAFELMLDRRSEEIQAVGVFSHVKKPTIHISGKVATPLQLELSTQSYRQLFDVIDNISGGKETVSVPPPAGMQTSTSVTGLSSQSPSTMSLR